MKIFATRPKLFMSWLLALKAGFSAGDAGSFSAPCLPNCATNLPSRVNFRMWASGPPLPPIQTKPLWSTTMPWFDSGQS